MFPSPIVVWIPVPAMGFVGGKPPLFSNCVATACPVFLPQGCAQLSLQSFTGLNLLCKYDSHLRMGELYGRAAQTRWEELIGAKAQCCCALAVRDQEQLPYVPSLD